MAACAGFMLAHAAWAQLDAPKPFDAGALGTGLTDNPFSQVVKPQIDSDLFAPNGARPTPPDFSGVRDWSDFMEVVRPNTGPLPSNGALDQIVEPDTSGSPGSGAPTTSTRQRSCLALLGGGATGTQRDARKNRHWLNAILNRTRVETNPSGRLAQQYALFDKFQDYCYEPARLETVGVLERGDTAFCTATLVADDVVLTARHCVSFVCPTALSRRSAEPFWKCAATFDATWERARWNGASAPGAPAEFLPAQLASLRFRRRGASEAIAVSRVLFDAASEAGETTCKTDDGAAAARIADFANSGVHPACAQHVDYVLLELARRAVVSPAALPSLGALDDRAAALAIEGFSNITHQRGGSHDASFLRESSGGCRPTEPPTAAGCLVHACQHWPGWSGSPVMSGDEIVGVVVGVLETDGRLFRTDASGETIESPVCAVSEDNDYAERPVNVAALLSDAARAEVRRRRGP